MPHTQCNCGRRSPDFYTSAEALADAFAHYPACGKMVAILAFEYPVFIAQRPAAPAPNVNGSIPKSAKKAVKALKIRG